MKNLQLTKQAKKKLALIKKSHPKIEKNISAVVLNLKEGDEVYKGETLQGYSDFRK
jgi:mRNA-degrading endonuclease YafQ of YafQ-DinJ toxin-antitoxin module